MLSFKQYLNEEVEGSLSIFDIDDTLFHSKSKVLVKKDGKTVKELEPAEYNVYKLEPGETYDFSQFRSSKIFYDTARPIETVFKLAKRMIAQFGKYVNKKIIIVTARSDLDNKNLFLKTFQKYGFNTDKVHVYRAGNISKPGAEAKKQIIRDQIKVGKYNIVRMFDDDHNNLNKFLELAKEFAGIKFEAFAITKQGQIQRYR